MADKSKQVPFWKKRPEYDLPIKCFIVLLFAGTIVGDSRSGLFDFWDVLFGFYALMSLSYMYRDLREIRRQLKETKELEKQGS